MDYPAHRFCIAPMMTHTDRHFRYFIRLISRRVLLYTEMVTTGALLQGDRDRHLTYHAAEHPLAMQLGGSEPRQLGHCAELAEAAGFAEINLNVGCPSNRVQAGRFGACLMHHPELVAESVAAMAALVAIPVTVKTRIGVDDSDDYEFLRHFVDTVAQAGCRTFIIHARKAILRGLSPRQNRHVPPLNYAHVYRIKRDFPELEVIINGGLDTMERIEDQYHHVDGVMIGRAACHDPYMLATVDTRIFGDSSPIPERREIFAEYLRYVDAELEQGGSLHRTCRNIFGLFRGMSGARAYRRFLSAAINTPGAGTAVLEQAMEWLESRPAGSPVTADGADYGRDEAGNAQSIRQHPTGQGCVKPL